MIFFISTPIGNLSDMSQRLKETLESVDFVIAEDTRNSIKILNHLNIKKELISFHEHSDEKKLNYIIERVQDGQKAAYLSDAGAPNLSDPGGKLASEALNSKITISPIPGPSSLTTLISVAPFSCSKFTFLGYFPKKKGREKIIKEIEIIDQPVFFLESCHRIKKTLIHLKKHLPNYNILIGRELTKKFEEIIYENLADLEVESIIDKGEFILAIVELK